jgi:hypothetical protein
MKKKKIIQACEYYQNRFKNSENISHYDFLELFDFAQIHLESKSFLLFELNKGIDNSDYPVFIDHIKSHIIQNDSKINRDKNNFLSSIGNGVIITIIIFLLTVPTSISYYFGNRDRINKKEISETSTPAKPFDSISDSIKITNQKTKID